VARVLRPPALRPGATVGVCAPSGWTRPERLAVGIARLQDAGLRVVVGRSTFARDGYLAGEDAARAADLNALIADDDVAAILCARGGYGASRLLPLLDLSPLARRPKPVVGFSDITALHLAWARAGVVSLDGPVMEAGPDDEVAAANLTALIARLADPGPWGPVAQPPGAPALRTLVPGRARGVLRGGNLSLLAATCGTPWQLDAAGAILVLEDVDEAPYRIDRMLTQLQQAGALAGVAGVVVGELVGCEPDGGSGAAGPTAAAVFARHFAALAIPCFAGLACGHGRHRLTLPFGVAAEIDADACTLAVTEPVWAS
jgi:muramoyltetrapeptide carboxypeptidase